MHYDSAAKYLPKAVSPAIAVYNVTGISALAGDKQMAPLLTTQKPRLSFKFVIDASGQTDLVRAEASVEEMVKVIVEKVNATAANATAEAAEGEKKEGDAAAPAAPADSEKAAEKPAEGGDDAKADKEKEKADGIQTEVNADGVEIQYRLKKKTHRFTLSVSKAAAPGSIAPLNKEQKAAVRALYVGARLCSVIDCAL